MALYELDANRPDRCPSIPSRGILLQQSIRPSYSVT